MIKSSPYDQAIEWLEKQPSAVSGSGGHNQTFAVVCALTHGFGLSDGDVRALLKSYSARCSPPWSENELEHKVSDANRTPPSKPRGYMLRRGNSFKAHSHSTHHKPKPMETQSTDLGELPEPLADGTRTLLRAVFLPGEGVGIANAKFNEDDHEIPADSGACLSREEWLRKLEAVDGNPNGIWSSSKKTGIYIRINPMRIGGSKDSDVTAFRHALVEFDNISLGEQWNLYQQSRIPCSAIISSGGKSIHAWVKVEARDRKEYDERVKVLYDYFGAAGHQIDTKNKNPSRFSRLPNCVRFNSRQELLALNTGAESWSLWQAEVQADGIGETVSVDTLLAFDPETDPNSILGQRWLCRGGSALLIAPSGVGKSSLSTQLAATWAIGLPAFGIKPIGPLKSLIVQAENDIGDLSEMLQGVFYGFDPLSAEQDALFRSNLVFVRDTTHTGWAFTEALRRLIDRHRPDIVWLDPILSFIGADISKQEVCSQFFRTWLNPISDATGVVWICIHHTGKPPNDAKARKGWTDSDHSYSGIGSSDLVNWARAAIVLRAINDRQFELKFTKRGKRAGAKLLTDVPASTIWIAHSQSSIRWEQIDAPEQTPSDRERVAPKQPKETPIPQQIATSNCSSFLAGCTAEGENLADIRRRIENWAASDLKKNISGGSTRRTIDALIANGKLSKVDGKYRKGPNA